MDWPKTRKVALLIGALSMVITPVLAEATSLPQLNHYSDYGLVEQGQTTGTNTLSISNDPFGYSDEYTDSESGLQYLQVRYYDPAIMRFTQMDTYPLLNRYAYANENPIMNDDPSGHDPVGVEDTGDTHAKFTTTKMIVGLSITAILMVGALLLSQPEAAAGEEVIESTLTEEQTTNLSTTPEIIDNSDMDDDDDEGDDDIFTDPHHTFLPDTQFTDPIQTSEFDDTQVQSDSETSDLDYSAHEDQSDDEDQANSRTLDPDYSAHEDQKGSVSSIEKAIENMDNKTPVITISEAQEEDLRAFAKNNGYNVHKLSTVDDINGGGTQSRFWIEKNSWLSCLVSWILK